MTQTANPPKVFISYSWTSEEHKKYVLNLAEKLRSDGVDVILDRWDLKKGHDKYAFMEKMVNDPTVGKVLVVSDRVYAEKADERKGGVGTESQIISQEIYGNVAQEKFIPIVTEFDDEGKPCLPTFMKARIYTDLSSDEKYFSGYEEILRAIFGKPAVVKPQLGVPPSYITDDSPRPLKTIHKFAAFRDAIKHEKASSGAASAEYLQTLLESFEDFRIDVKKNDYDDDLVNSIREFKPYRDQFIEYASLIAQYSSDHKYYEQIFDFFEKAMEYHYPPEGVTPYYEGWYDNYRFVLWELFIYLVAVLIENKAFDAIDLFLGETYFVNTSVGGRSMYFKKFNSYCQALDEIRNKRLQLSRESFSADLLKERADIKRFSFEHLMQADFVLALRSVLLLPHSDHWYPRTLHLRPWRRGPFEIFQKAESKRHFDAITRLFHVTNKQDLLTKLGAAQKPQDPRSWERDLAKLVNSERLYGGE
ncbi:MAG: TIR domain-containing protein [Candidatus Coatesbacteria bacterium]|nr:TIR domain-containing protein [Candidatus Coatesbacteria bacterium]